jgi:eukaryotic-like serine/threonine-protein kinase
MSSMIGQQFGNYRALELLGEGGMGAVYLAEHPGIGRRVAVKVLHKNYTRDESLLGRFLNEARAANAIRHPNIIEILDSGQQADGTPFLVMELLEGESLGARIRAHGGLPLPAALEFAYQTASALGAAHKKGIVHRDLKPDNLFIVPDPHDPERERIKVLDFGIAKLQQSPSDSVKTRTGTLMGTPIYMSPEQCLGTKTVDHRSDIYSLGVIFYEMLIGAPPFVSEGFGELVNMHLNVAPRSPRSERPDIPEPVEALVMRMLSKAPDQRHADMTEIQQALKASGGFSVRSSPDLAKTHAPKSMGLSSTKLRDTTFSTGTGERVDTPAAGMGGGKKAAVAVVAAAAVIAGFVMFGRGGKMDVAPPVAVAPAPAVAAAPTPEPPAPPVERAPVNVKLRLSSTPAGAMVIDDADGAKLGTTPIELTRAKGGSITLRLEKDGYASGTRVVSLDSDHTVDLALAPTPKPKTAAKPKSPKKPREPSEPSDAPAKL